MQGSYSSLIIQIGGIHFSKIKFKPYTQGCFLFIHCCAVMLAAIAGEMLLAQVH